MNATFNIPTVQTATKAKDVEWDNLDLNSLPEVLADQVKTIHAMQEELAKMKKTFADQFNAAYSEEVPAGLVRRFSFKFDGLSFASLPPGKGQKAKVQFTAKKASKK